MSWASRLASAPNASAATVEKPTQYVYGIDPSVSQAERKLQNVDHATAMGVHLPTYIKGLLVLDANAFIKGMENFNTLADAFITTPQVIAEVRDKASREVMERLPHRLTILDPTAASMTAVLGCAERTGDLGVLSRTDIRLCALALDCCRGANCLRPAIETRAPTMAPMQDGSDVRIVHDAQSASDAEKDEEEDDAEQSEDETGSRAQGRNSNNSKDSHATSSFRKRDHMKKSNSNTATDSNGDDDGEWITASNIEQIQAGGGVAGIGSEQNREFFDGEVACVTSDFAMQNVLMHLGVPLITPAGMRIHELRLWLLRCTSCFTVVSDTTRQFCPSCGSGDTLRRVNYVVNRNGQKTLFINFSKHISTRGTIYNLPKPHGGKHGTNRTLVLREDQLGQVIRGKSGAKAKAAHVTAEFCDDLAAFGEAPKHKKRNLADPKTVSSYHRYNMNEKKKVRAAHRK